jgi:hypothetical protein
MALGIRQIKIISETNAFIYQVVTARSFGGLRMTEFCEGLSSYICIGLIIKAKQPDPSEASG